MDFRVNSLQSAYGVYKTGQTTAAKKTEKTGRTEGARDEFLLSTQAEDYQAARKALANVPDIRWDRVSQIQSSIQTGTYHVTPGDIADKLMQGYGD